MKFLHLETHLSNRWLIKERFLWKRGSKPRGALRWMPIPWLTVVTLVPHCGEARSSDQPGWCGVCSSMWSVWSDQLGWCGGADVTRRMLVKPSPFNRSSWQPGLFILSPYMFISKRQKGPMCGHLNYNDPSPSCHRASAGHIAGPSCVSPLLRQCQACTSLPLF